MCWRTHSEKWGCMAPVVPRFLRQCIQLLRHSVIPLPPLPQICQHLKLFMTLPKGQNEVQVKIKASMHNYIPEVSNDTIIKVQLHRIAKIWGAQIRN